MTNSNELRTFEYAGLQLRILTISDEPWFVVMDALYALDYPQKSHGMIVRKLDADESILKRIENAPQTQSKAAR